MKLGAAALVAALLFLAAVFLQSDDEQPLVAAPPAIRLGVVGGANPTGSATDDPSPRTSPEPSWVKHDVEYEDIEGFDDDSDDSGKGSDNSGSGSDDDGGDDS
jgi:hypothetical protein